MLSSLAAVILMSANGFAQNIPADPSVRIGTLPNGMKYYIKKNTLPEKKVDFRLPSMQDPFWRMKTREALPILWST